MQDAGCVLKQKSQAQKMGVRLTPITTCNFYNEQNNNLEAKTTIVARTSQ